MTESVSKGQARFSAMAHLFLSDLRSPDRASEVEEKTAGVNAPEPARRIGPGEQNNSYPPPQQQTDPSFGTDPSFFSHPLEAEEQALASLAATAGDPAEEEQPSRLQVIGVHCSHLRWDGNKALAQFARTLAGQGKVVGVLKLEAWSAHLRIYYRKPGPNQPGPMGRPVPEPDEYGEDRVRETLEPDFDLAGGVFGQLEALAGKLDFFLIGWGPEFGPQEHRLYPLLDAVCVIASSKPEKLVGAYRVLKGLKGRTENRVGIFVDEATGFAQARSVFQKLAGTARDFIGMELEDYGYSLSEGVVVQELLARTELRTRVEEWFSDLERWICGRKEGGEMAPGPERIESPPLRVKPGVSPPAPVEEPSSQVLEPDDGIVIIDDCRAKEGVAERLGPQLLPGGRSEKDDLIRFLQSIGLDCVKICHPDGGTAVILCLNSEEDLSAGVWAMMHYPNRDDRLVLVTDRPLGRLERGVWKKCFNQVEVKQVLRGSLHGRRVRVVQR